MYGTEKTHNVKRYLFHFVGLIYTFGRDAKEHAYLLITGIQLHGRRTIRNRFGCRVSSMCI